MKLRIKQYFPFLLTMLIVLSVWQLCGYLNLLPKFILPTPMEIIQALINDFPLILQHSKITLLETVIGLSIGIIGGFVLAILMDRYITFYKIMYPISILTQTIPTVAIAPILVLWFGYGIFPKVILIVLATLFPILMSVFNGFKQCDEDAIKFLKLMNANDKQILWYVKLPTSLGYFFSGLRVSVTYALISAVVSEWLGGYEGLGVYMTRVRKAFAYDKMFAVIVFVSVLSLVLLKCVDYLQVKYTPWNNIEGE